MPEDSAPVIARSWRNGAMVVAGVASGLLVLIGCTRVADGNGSADVEAVSEYHTSLSVSQAESSRSAESSSKQAMADACTTFATMSNAAVSAGNELIDAMNNEGGYGRQAESKAGPVSNAISTSAKQVDDAKAAAQTNDVRDALAGYSDQARKLAAAIDSRYNGDSLNAAVQTFNDARNRAQSACAPYLPKS